MDYLPVFHRLTGQRCLLVGGGQVALRKARLLHRAGARLTVIAPTVEAELAQLVASSGGTVLEREFQESDVSRDFVLVVAATASPSVNGSVSRCCKQVNIPVNVVDSKALSTAIFPSLIDRSPFIVALSSSATSPVLLRVWRERLEALLPQRLGTLAEFAGHHRDKVRERIPESRARRRFWEASLLGQVGERVFAGDDSGAARTLDESLNDPQLQNAIGEVFLVGAGPGDPELLTLKALRLMQLADVVLYDNLVSTAVLDLVRRDATRIYVGKRRSYGGVRQEQINEQLVTLAKAGNRVVRLKGGDPFVFGRGGEEIESLVDQGIHFQVVPGITAANGCAAYAGIPLTHRDFAQSVRFVTGHLRDGQLNLDWPELAKPGQTLVIYMGLTGVTELCRRLLDAGAPPDLPAALIEKGTLPEQRVVVGTVSTLPADVAAQEVRGPTLTIIGEVVRLRDRLRWR